MTALLDPKELYAEMQGFDFDPVLRTAVQECGIEDRARAEELLHAFLQWFSIVPFVDHDHVFVMLKTDVDQIFHAFVLNTRAYQEFCQQFVGQFIHHTPLDDSTAKSLEGGVTYTVDLLEHFYGDQLSPELAEWRDQLEKGAWVVSCPGSCYDIRLEDTIAGRMANGAVIVH